ncbi:hypothetical protein RM780_20620 [Streptomyces sp. DSM 44917]|uniref:Serine/threonine protein kinase n=1 Tax=Streptomyces boetiae TaxID=3075541 RepID=A0ABU2LCV9_9ACTN|nr:hypothetical protein [Streptomyces sp. DSM 44917]MDT0309345.1 hypothetical protein [Streptomyces sp. DSM 44917]
MTEDGHEGREGREGHDDRTVAVLRRRLRAADEEIAPPLGLWDRVRAPGPATQPPRPSARWPAVALAAVAVAFVAAGTWWWVRPAATEQPPAGPGPGLELAVYNAEEPCQELRTLECSLGLARDPYAEYAAPENAAGRVWHGDRLEAYCVVADGTPIMDEDGISSTRWYRVRTAGGNEGWLPGVRTRNEREVPFCED